MPFSKGQSGNPNGRPTGSRNKSTLQLREAINDLLSENFDKVKEDFKKLDPRDRIKFYIDLLQYGLPKLRAVETNSEYEALSNDELDTIINELTHVANQQKG